MNRWFCMDCRSKVEIDRHGRCGTCDSEAVILAEAASDVTRSVSMGNADNKLVQAAA